MPDCPLWRFWSDGFNALCASRLPPAGPGVYKPNQKLFPAHGPNGRFSLHHIAHFKHVLDLVEPLASDPVDLGKLDDWNRPVNDPTQSIRPSLAWHVDLPDSLSPDPDMPRRGAVGLSDLPVGEVPRHAFSDLASDRPVGLLAF